MKRLGIVLFILFASCSYGNAQESKISYSGEYGVVGSSVFRKQGRGIALSLETSQGVRFGNRSFTGIGSGITYSLSTKEFFIPVYLHEKVFISDNTQLKPFVSGKIGGLFCAERRSNAFVFNPSIGFEWSKLSLSLGYVFQYAVDKNQVIAMGSYDWVTTKGCLNGVNLGISIVIF